MPLCFFHMRDGVDTLIDPEGREIALEAVPAEALKEARAIIGADALAGIVMLDRHIAVETAAGVIVHRLEFTDAVQLVLPPPRPGVPPKA